MKISKRTVDDLLTLIEHSRRDMSYGGGGSFVSERIEKDGDYGYNEKDGKKAERAINFIKEFLLAPATTVVFRK